MAHLMSKTIVTQIRSYLDLAGTNNIAYRTRGQNQRHEENEWANTSRCSALKEYIKPNTKAKIQRQKVPDDEDIDIDKIAQGNKMIEIVPQKLKSSIKRKRPKD